MDIKHTTHIHEYEKDGVTHQYKFDTRSKEVEFVEYVSNKVISKEPYTEEVVEKWYIKPLDCFVKITRTSKYFGELAKRRQLKKFGKYTSNYASVGEDVFIEWNPSVLGNSNILKYANNYVKTRANDDLDESNVLYFNKNISQNDKNSMMCLSRYEDLINNVNEISNNKMKQIRKTNRRQLLPTPREGENLVQVSKKENEKMKEISSTNNSSSQNGLFVPVHLRKGITKSHSSQNDDTNNNKQSKNSKVFQVPKKQHAPRYTFVFKGLPNPEDLTQDIIKNIIYDNSYTYRTSNNPRACSVFILKDRNTGKQKNMCLIHFKNKELKEQVLSELQNTRITFEHVIITVEDGRTV